MSKLRCTLCPALALVLLAVAGCDAEPEEPRTPEPTFRTEHEDCRPMFVGTQGGAFNYHITPNPDDPDSPDGPVEPWHAADIIHNTNRAFGISFQSLAIENKETCEASCAEAGLRWNGGACVFESDYAFGEWVMTEDESGNIYSGVDVEASVEPGCACG